MKYDIQFTNQFKKDLKLAKKQNKNLDKLFEVIKRTCSVCPRNYSTYFPFLTASAKARKLSDFMIARPCLSSPSTTS